MAWFDTNSRWTQNGVTIVGGIGRGYEMNQVHHSRSVFVDNHRSVYVTDHDNHRISDAEAW
jgi:hypothetical protein